MLANSQPIVCKSCAKPLATSEESGLVPDTSTTGVQSCDTCEQFRPLFDAMQTADEEYLSFRGRQDNYRPKQDAFANVKKTHMQFDNFLMSVEGTVEETQIAPFKTYAGAEEDRSQGTKRPKSSSSVSEAFSTTPPPDERKRLRFSDSVEFREHYRPSQHYSRSDEAYERGRYAPPEGSEHLDTSGSVKTFLKFTGMKKVGKEWVDVWKEDEEGERTNSKEKTTNNNDTSIADIETVITMSTAGYDTMQLEAASTDAGAQRLKRRSNGTLETPSPRRTRYGRGQTQRTDLSASSSSTTSDSQPTDTPRALIQDIAVAETHTTKSAIAGENTETQSSHTKISGNSIRKDAASPLTAADRELIRETYMVQDNQNPPDADSIAEQHSLDSGHDFVDKKDQQHASERQRGGSETNFERNEEKGESLDDNAELAADNKTACLPVRFTNDGKDERTPCLGQNNQPSVDGNEPGSRHRSATPSPRQTPPVHAPHD
jgi:hypothetical protein